MVWNWPAIAERVHFRMYGKCGLYLSKTSCVHAERTCLSLVTPLKGYILDFLELQVPITRDSDAGHVQGGIHASHHFPFAHSS